MPIRIVRLGTARTAKEGVRLGTVRRPPRGIRKSDFARLDFYDVWLPALSPTETLLRQSFPIANAAAWKTFTRTFLAQMKQPAASQLLDALAALSKQSNFSLGCYCEHEAHCHRSLLRRLLAERGAMIDPS